MLLEAIGVGMQFLRCSDRLLSCCWGVVGGSECAIKLVQQFKWLSS